MSWPLSQDYNEAIQDAFHNVVKSPTLTFETVLPRSSLRRR
jgi:hypothetical protein